LTSPQGKRLKEQPAICEVLLKDGGKIISPAAT
jgi:hypothetical protein